MGDTEIRFESDPFPLYPGEELEKEGNEFLFKLRVIATGKGLHVLCIRDFTNEKGEVVPAGAEWIEEGPKTYIPHVAVKVLDELSSTIIKPNSALRIRARVDFTDRTGVARRAGESWLIRKTGAYLPSVEERIDEVVEGVVLSDRFAVHVRALENFTDAFGKERKTGETWLVTHKETPVYIVDVHEKIAKQVKGVSLNSRQYCIVQNPVGPDGTNRYGMREVRRGEQSFFLRPGEELVEDVRDAIVLGKDEALLLKALSEYKDGDVVRPAGSIWMLYGPLEFVPDDNVEIVETRKLIALDKNEGVYVMNTVTGDVRAVIGEPYLPTENEVLWEKHLSKDVEELLTCPGGSRKTGQTTGKFVSKREKHRIVRFNVQHNAAVQIYDYIKKQQRIVLGPGLVILGPHEEFTVL
ncbi:major vault protein, partial [Angomonas deanei]